MTQLCRRGLFSLAFFLLLSGLLPLQPLQAANDSNGRYEIGSPQVTEIWVDPVKGKEQNSGKSRKDALNSLGVAWERIPADKMLSNQGYRIMLAGGHYRAEALPDNGWMEGRLGTAKAPVIIEAADGPGTAILHGYLNIYQCRYLYLIGLSLVTDAGYGDGGNVIHIEQGDHILIRSCKLNGFDGAQNRPQETLKVNQSQYIYLEDSRVSGAYWFAVDFVAVQYGHLRGNQISNSEDDCVVLKGGTAQIRIEGNEIHHCGNIGFSAGQGTGYEFMMVPWLHYEAYDLKFINNLVHDVQNAGMAVRGGYNILLAYNTLYKIAIGANGPPLLLVSPGARSCDGDTAACQKRFALGGWGPIDGDAGECIPNRNVYVFNNIFVNPPPYQTECGHFSIFGPFAPPKGTNIPAPVRSDDNLRIAGNIIWKGPVDHPLGIEVEDSGPGATKYGAQPDNPTCNAKLLRADNWINQFEPQMVNPANSDWRPVKKSRLTTLKPAAIPDFPGGDLPKKPQAPQGDLKNVVLYDYQGNSRAASNTLGALLAIQ